MPKTLIVSVGGTTSPIICSINYHRPENIIFFVSAETEFQIAEIMRKVNIDTIKNIDRIMTESAENIGLCLKAIMLKLPEIIKRWRVPPEDIIVDYTGGTKSMSAAIVLGTIEYTHCFSYIGGERRNKQGIGVVVDGQEKVLILNNPWEQLAVIERKKISILFNSGLYSSAKRAAEEAANKVASLEKNFYEIIKYLSEAYYKWDMFDFNGAYHFLRRARHELEIFCSHPATQPEFCYLLDQVKENEKILESLKEIESPLTEIKNLEVFLLDLLANAKRRATLENRYDDAVVRLYRAIELRSQIELKKYGLEASDINLNLIPEKIKEDIRSKYFNEKKQKIEVPLYASYQILKAIEEEKGITGIGHKFFENYEKLLSPIVDTRNKSIAVHGYERIGEAKFNLAWQNTINFLEIDETSLPAFPKLNLNFYLKDSLERI